MRVAWICLHRQKGKMIEYCCNAGSLKNRLKIRHANWPPKIPSVMREGTLRASVFQHKVKTHIKEFPVLLTMVINRTSGRWEGAGGDI